MQLESPSRFAVVLALFVAAALGRPGLARAQAAEPAGGAKTSVTPPELLHDPGVNYPQTLLEAGEFTRTTVSLILEIGPDGSVKSATLEGPGRAVFDEPALAAARQLRFQPATRAGAPVAAKIRFQYTFEPPPTVLAGRVIDDVSGQPVANARIRVKVADGTEVELTTDADGSFRRENLARGKAQLWIEAAGFLAQQAEFELSPLRAVEIRARLERPAKPEQPGQGADASGPSKPVEILVRGERLAPAVSSLTRGEVRQLPGAFGDPFRALEALPGVTPIVSGLPFFYVRGAPPGNVGYYVDGIRIPFLYHVAVGPSVIHPGLIERVDLYPGGYPAELGRYAGGIVSAETAPPKSELHGEANVRTFDAGALVETGFAGGRGSILLGGRYSYTAAMLSLSQPDIKLDYRDYQARITYDVTNRDRVSLLSLGSYDLLGEKQRGGLRVLFGSEFYRVDLRHEHRFDQGVLTSAVTLGFDQSKIDEEGNALDRSLAVRSSYRHELGPRSLFRAGIDARLDEYSTSLPKYTDPDNPDNASFHEYNPSRTDVAAGVWSDFVLHPAPGIEVTPGLRLDLYHSQDTTIPALDPRISARFTVSPRVTIVHAYGIAHQPPAFVVPLPGVAPTLAGGLQESFQSSAGVEVELGWGTKGTATVFYNAFFNMTDALANPNGGSPDDPDDPRAMGSAVGFELFIHRRLTQRLGGFLSYTLSRSMRSIEREHFPNTFDRAHVMNLALAYDLGRNWRAGTRVVFYTGMPVLAENDGTIPELRTQHPERTDPFFRVDLRIEKRWNLSETTWLAFVAEMLNATLSKEEIGEERIGPITIPSIGVEAGF